MSLGGMSSLDDIKGEGDGRKEPNAIGEILLEVDDVLQAYEIDEVLKTSRFNEK